MRPAAQEEVVLFTMMGQALLNIQVLEECLSASITLKVDVGYPRKLSKAEADEKLKRRLRKYTLGNAIKEAAEKSCMQRMSSSRWRPSCKSETGLRTGS